MKDETVWILIETPRGGEISKTSQIIAVVMSKEAALKWVEGKPFRLIIERPISQACEMLV